MKIRYTILILLLSMISFSFYMSRADTIKSDLVYLDIMGLFLFMGLSFVNLMFSLGFKKF